MAKRRVLVHYHIYKNAGSSIDRLLLESFGEAFAMLEATDGSNYIDAAALRHFLESRPHIKAVASHGAHPPLPFAGALPIVMLRHPADRAMSAWRFARLDSTMPDHAVARDGSFDDYVRWSVATRGPGAVLRDHQVAHLSDAARRQHDDTLWPATAADLAEAKARLARWPAFGLVRRFDDSCRLFNARYRRFHPALRLAGVVENATRAERLDDAAALAQLRDQLAPATYAALCAANVLDLDLYAFASTLFDRHIADLGRVSRAIGWRLALAGGKIRNRLS